MTLSTVVAGVDSSPLARDALRWGRQLASCTDAAVRVVGCWQMPLVGLLALPFDGLPTPDFMADRCRSATLRAVADADCVADELMFIEGKPGPSLVEASSDADLLVVGRTGHGKRHGVSRIAEIVLGSTARHCLHHSEVPVAVVPSGASWPEDGPVVMVGVDGSSNSIQALEWVLTTFPADTKLHVVRAFAPWVGDGLTPLDLVTDTALISSFTSEATEWVNDAVSRVGSNITNPATMHMTIGRAIDALLESQVEPDLIVVGERGHTGITARMLGSVADHVVRHAPCPVIVVPVTRSEPRSEGVVAELSASA